MSNFYGATNLTGGGSGALDKLDGAALVNGDGALVITSAGALTYALDAASGAAENSPDIIAPDTNPGTKRWILVNMVVGPEFAELIGGGGTTLHSHVGFIPSLELVDSYDTGDGNEAAIYDVRFEGQTFTAGKNYTIAAIELKLRSDTQVNEMLTVSIYATAGSPALPTGPALCTGVINAQDLTDIAGGEWEKILLGTGAALTSGSKYAIGGTAITGDNTDILWRVDVSGSYATGARIYDSGGDGWDDEVAAHDFMFRTFEAATALNTAHRGSDGGDHSKLTGITSIQDFGRRVAFLGCPFYNSIIQGSWTVALDIEYWYYYHILNGGADGDELNFKIYLEAGTYTLKFIHAKGANTGIVDIYIDGDEVASVDTYAGSGSKNIVASQGSIVVSSPGVKTIRVVVDGKNGSSSGYYLNWTGMWFL